MTSKSRHVRVRFEEPLYLFIERYGRTYKRDMSVSDVVRNICTLLFIVAENPQKKVLRMMFSDKKRKQKFMKFLDKI